MRVLVTGAAGFIGFHLAKRLLERALTYLQIPSSPDLPLPPPQIASVDDLSPPAPRAAHAHTCLWRKRGWRRPVSTPVFLIA